MKRGMFLVASCGLATAALAQPAATDLGALTIGTPTTASPTLAAANEVLWYTFTIGAGTSAEVYLDIDTEGTALAPGNDCEIGLFSSDGTLIASDDDDGSGLMSALSFGGGCVSRPGAAGGTAFNGRDGSLAAGTYFVSFTGYNSTFAAGWSVVSASVNLGAGQLSVRYGTVVNTPTPGEFVEPCGADAGDVPSNATAADGQTGSLNTIRGTIGVAADSDMYIINVCDAASFSASTVGGTTLDTQLFLFNLDGTGVVFNDDVVGGTVLQSALTSQFVTQNGQYLLAVSAWDRDPVDAAGGALWIDTPFRSERAPDGPSASSPMTGWTGTGGTGSYAITLTGACFAGPSGPICNDIDFNNDGSFFDPDDVDAFFSVFSEGPCIPATATCDGVDFNNDGSLFDPCDIDAFFLVFSEGPCTLCGE